MPELDLGPDEFRPTDRPPPTLDRFTPSVIATGAFVLIAILETILVVYTGPLIASLVGFMAATGVVAGWFASRAIRPTKIVPPPPVRETYTFDSVSLERHDPTNGWAMLISLCIAAAILVTTYVRRVEAAQNPALLMTFVALLGAAIGALLVMLYRHVRNARLSATNRQKW